MTQHLTWEQISDCLIGDASASTHTNECVSCRSEVARLEAALTEFRGSIRHWSDQALSNHVSRSVLGNQIVSTTIPSRGMYSGNEIKAGMSSLLVNAVIVALLLVAGTVGPVQKRIAVFVPLIAPNLRPLPKPEVVKGGGGSPQNSQATKGKLPKAAPRLFIPPVQPVDEPRLAINPTILAPDMPSLSAQNLGNPLASLGLPSNGNGLGIGIGGGKGPGSGPGSGGGGMGGGVYRPGGGVTAPVPVVRPEPEYSEEARKAKWSGSVTVQIVVDENGLPQNIQVTKALGMGLDQKAIEAVKRWRFKPGTKDGKPVPVIATIEVNFRLL